MKNLSLIFSIVMLVLAGMVQATAQSVTETPRDGFVVAFASNQVEVKSGESQTIEAEILRSKGFRRANIELKVMPLPEGINLEINPKGEETDEYTLTVNVAEGVQAGNYTATILGKSWRLNKGALLTIKVGKTTQPNTGTNPNN